MDDDQRLFEPADAMVEGEAEGVELRLDEFERRAADDFTGVIRAQQPDGGGIRIGNLAGKVDEHRVGAVDRDSSGGFLTFSGAAQAAR